MSIRTKVEEPSVGRSYTERIPDAAVEVVLGRGFRAAADFQRLGQVDAVLICVPTPPTDAREPELTYVVNSAYAVAGQLRPGQLVVPKSTTCPTTTRDGVLPVPEQTGLKVGSDFFLAFSPEREDPGNADHGVHNIPKVVGGLDAQTAAAACALYEAVVPEVAPVSSPEVAEAYKILRTPRARVGTATRYGVAPAARRQADRHRPSFEV